MAAGDGTAVFTIAPGLPFVDLLAEGILQATGGDPMELAGCTVLLPTRRACRALRDAFLRVSGGRPLLLPRLRPLSDPDEDELTLGELPGGEAGFDLPPAIPPLRRQLLLARLIMAMGGGRGGQPPRPEQAAQLAAELGSLLDQVQTEGLSFDRLAGLVPAEYAAHWQITLDFLALLTRHWPKILAEEGFIDGALRQRRLLLAQAEQWRSRPPEGLVVAAGSTGSVPATAELLATVAGLPRGMVVLPGLDRDMDDASWQALDHTHPQNAMKRLLERIGVERRDVRLWLDRPSPRPARRRLIGEAMRPAATTDAWRAADGLGAEALDGLARIDCPGPREEAGAIALLLREALEEPERTAALVTPDRALARRVAAEMRRWGVEVDDSGGRPLALTVPGVFLRLVAAMVAEEFAPHATLAALKHPLAAGGEGAAAFRRRVRRLEIAALRGPRPAPGLAGLRRAVGDERLGEWLQGLEAAAEPFLRLMARPAAPLGELLRAHVAFAEALAADDREAGAARLWRGDAGEAAARFVADLADAAGALPEIAGADYPGLLDTLMAGRVVRPAWGGHPRVHIWGPLEARLQHADLIVLGGLVEGTWPPATEADPWMSRPMRASFGLPLPERRIGLSAHDFAQAFCAPRVVLTRAVRVEGTPTVPSRWLMRLDAVLQACGLAGAMPSGPWPDWFLTLDRPQAVEPGRPPAPRPPVEARPRELSATQIETWMRDPYAIYARKVLRLKALDPIDADPGAADYGNIVHEALERFLEEYPGPLPADAEERLLAIGRQRFEGVLARPGVWAFWWPRFRRIARWFVAVERDRRAEIVASHCEVNGALEIAGPAGPFRVTAKADRIDVLADGSVAVIDYKTGAPPSKREVKAGFAPQLPIEAAIVLHGGFPGVPSKAVASLEYWRLRGNAAGGEISLAGDDPATLAAEAVEGVAALVRLFDDPATPYEARPHPEHAPRYSDYLHLARVKEWASGGEDEG